MKPSACLLTWWRLLFATSLLFTTSPLAPQIGRYNPPSPAEAKYSLSGTIVNSVTGEPVSHALVQIDVQTQRMVFSDGEGHFLFAHLPRIQTSLNVIKPGFIQEGHSELGGGVRQVMISIGLETSPITVKLIPEATIEGRITDSSGEPLDNVPVKIFSFSIQEGIRKKRDFRQIQTDEDGEFQFSELPPGDYIVSAGPSWKDLSDPFQAGGTDRLAYAQMFYPGVQELADATVIHVAAAKHQRNDFSLNASPSFVVSGSVVGGVAGRFSLQFLNSAGQEMSIAQRRDGTEGFRARLTAGPCLLKVNSQDDQGNHFYGQVELNPSRDIRGLQIAMSQTYIPITVQRLELRESSPEFRGASDRVLNRPVSLRLISLDPFHPDIASETKGGPENWTSAITNVEYGRYRVEVNESDVWYAQSILHEGTDLRFEPLVVGPGASQPIDVVLRNDSASLKVAVVSASEQQETAVAVFAIAEQSPAKPVVRQLFSLKQALYFSLPPGKYSFYAFEDLSDLEYANPDVLKKFSASATVVELQTNQKASIACTLIRRTE
ncbi:MAG: hypothetical protein JWO20_2346 [Candidatus Angelobacter sp.]|jgi:hypothetical protein|nr:hypothetical protein [Candidatus Angelobacter sp.]